MCNAHNHPVDCTCGFGGFGHLGTGTGAGITNALNAEAIQQVLIAMRLKSLEINLSLYKSFVNPNAICPVCGATVFFYQSPHGGRVFFDSLGPPWPKHPCTDNVEIPEGSYTRNLQICFPWVNQYWPLVDLVIKHAGRGLYSVDGKILKEDTRDKVKFYVDRNLDFKRSDFAFFKEINLDTFEIVFYRIVKDKIEYLTGS